MRWLLWAALLIAQNASFTLVSRARNSTSLGYHAWASAASNLLWFVSQYILIENVLDLMRSGTAAQKVGVGVFYVLCTMIGSIGMHAFAMQKIERKVVQG